MILHSKICFKELSDYALLCQEHGVKKVIVDRTTYARVKELNFMSTSNKVVFMGIYFTMKK